MIKRRIIKKTINRFRKIKFQKNLRTIKKIQKITIKGRIKRIMSKIKMAKL